MKHQIDCLLIAYSGWDKDSVYYKILMEEDSRISKIPNVLNGAITYLGTSLEAEGFTFEFVNSIEDEPDRLVHLLQTYEIGSVGISTTLAPYEFEGGSKDLIELIALIRGINDKTPIILGGAYIMNYVRLLEEMDEESLQSALKTLNADFIVDSTYGEEKLAAIISQLKDDLPVDDIANLYVKKERRFYRTEKKKEEYLLQEKKINWSLFKGRTGGAVTIRTSVSCFNRCKFCTFPIVAGRYNNVGVKLIERELNAIYELGEVDLILFIDDTFNVPVRRFKDVLKMMIKNKYPFKWYGMIRCQALDEEAVMLMKDSGCIGVLLGIESGSDRVLKAMNKQATAEEYRRGIKLLKDYGIITFASFVIGFPEETRETAEETYRFIEETKPDFYDLNIWYYDTRAPIHYQRDQYDLKGAESNWSHKNMDSKTACEIIEDFEFRIKHSIWMGEATEYLLIQLIAGRGVEDVKNILRNVASGFREFIKYLRERINEGL